MPGTGAVNWESKETWERVVAAIIASGVKLNLRSVALHYGTTYDTLENRLRKVKKEAEVLKQEVESGERKEVKVPTTPRKPKTPKKEALSTVTNGRVSKASPSKSASNKKKLCVKQEDSDETLNDGFDNNVLSTDASFNADALNFDGDDFFNLH